MTAELSPLSEVWCLPGKVEQATRMNRRRMRRERMINRCCEVLTDTAKRWRASARQGRPIAKLTVCYAPVKQSPVPVRLQERYTRATGVTPVSSFASVWAYNEFGRYCGYGSVDFSGTGVYQILNLSTGDYYLQLSSYGQSHYEEYYRGVTDWQSATLVHVTDEQQTTGIDFVLHQYRGAIAGTVSSADSAPVAGCIVSAYDINYNPVAYAPAIARFR